MTTNKRIKDELRPLMTTHRRWTTNELAELAMDAAIVKAQDRRFIVLEFLKTLIREIGRENRRTPQLSFDSVTEDAPEGKREVWIRSRDATRSEANEIINHYEMRIRSLIGIVWRKIDDFNKAPRGYQMTFPFDRDEGDAGLAVA